MIFPKQNWIVSDERYRRRIGYSKDDVYQTTRNPTNLRGEHPHLTSLQFHPPLPNIPRQNLGKPGPLLTSHKTTHPNTYRRCARDSGPGVCVCLPYHLRRLCARSASCGVLVRFLRIGWCGDRGAWSVSKRRWGRARSCQWRGNTGWWAVA